MKKTHAAFKVFGLVVFAGLALSACRAEEQGRLLEHKPGVYLGKPNDQISEAALTKARQRTQMQGSGLSMGGDSIGRSSSVSPIRETDATYQKLRDRLQQQDSPAGK